MREQFATTDTGQGPARGMQGERLSGSISFKFVFVAAAVLLTANCSSQSVVSKVDPKYGVAASPIRISDGKDVPKGGGREMVGRPYTIAGRTFVPKIDENYSREGLASWYGPNFHGRQTANGEVFDKYSVSAAHPTMPLPSYARVTNLANDRSVIVRVNDRGPFHGNRIIDVSKTVAEALEFRHLGVSRVRVDYVGPASVDGSNDRTLISTLRSDGRMAELPGTGTSPVMVAAAEPAPMKAPPAAREAGPAAPPILAFVNSQPAAQQRATVVDVPLPPERPSEIARVAAASPLEAPRTALAGIFFAEPAPVATSLAKAAPFDNLAPLDLASLRRVR
jgi:rare lipoprotein A